MPLYACIICSNGIMRLRLLDVPKCSGPSNVLTLWSEREPGLEKLVFWGVLFLVLIFPKGQL